MADFGIWTVVPALFVLIIALKTKLPIESLILGCISTYVIIAISLKENFLILLTDSFFKVATDYDNVWLILVCGLFGSLIALLNESGGTHAIANAIGKICKSAKSVLMSAWGLGILIFIDDYMNIMTISSCMKRLCNKYKIPKSALAYVIDSTGAPACVLIPFSTWAVFFANSFYEQESVRALGYGSAIQTYIHAIPFMFYAMVALLIVPLFILGKIPLLGAMKKEYQEITTQENIIEENTLTGNPLDFLIPILLMIVITIISDDMFVALLISIFSCFLLYIPRKVMSLQKFSELWIKGFSDMIPALAIMLFAFYMKQACADINLPDYVLGICMPFVSKSLFPLITFIVVSVLAFITGDNWGVPAICVPIIFPLAEYCNANILVVMAAVVCGGVFCSHACFYSDATVLTSSSCGMDCMQHAKTQFPYAMISFAISAGLFLIMGFML